MTAFLPEPAYRHDQVARIGILLINLGTPEAPTAPALKIYLKEFLSDQRVVEIPRLLWWPILNGIILNTRPKKSAEKYASIWTAEGSPLKVHTEQQARRLATQLSAQRQEPVLVEWAMRYGQPNVEHRVMELKAQGVDRLLVIPLYPQYAASATGSALDALWAALLKIRNPPEVRVVRHFHDDSGYIEAWRRNIADYWSLQGRPEVLLMSFHGIPRRSLGLGDPYHCECLKTGRLLAEALGLGPDQYRITFQSRFGRAEWLQPYTAAVLQQLGVAHTRRVDVVCPGFTGDCLETLEEIAIEGKATFLSAGGGDFRYIPTLNEQPAWIEALGALATRHLSGWLEVQPEADAQTFLQERLARALALGAKS